MVMCLGRAVSLSTLGQEPDVVIAPIGWEMVVIGWMTSRPSLWGFKLALPCRLPCQAFGNALNAHAIQGKVLGVQKIQMCLEQRKMGGTPVKSGEVWGRSSYDCVAVHIVARMWLVPTSILLHFSFTT